MARELHDIDYLLGCHGPAVLADLLDVSRELVLIGFVTSGIVEADDRGVEVEIRLDSYRVVDVLRDAEHVGQEHEGAREDGVDLAVPIPKAAVVDVFGPVVGLAHVDVFEDAVEDMTHQHGTGECRIRMSIEGIAYSARLLFLALIEGIF